MWQHKRKRATLGELKQDISEQQADAHSEHTSAVGSALEELIDDKLDDELDYDEAEDTAAPEAPSAQPEPTVPDEPELRQSNGAAEPRDPAPDVKQEVADEAPAVPGKPQEAPSNAEMDGKTRRRIISLKSVKASCVVNDPTRTERAIRKCGPRYTLSLGTPPNSRCLASFRNCDYAQIG